VTGQRQLDVICPVFREELGIERFDTELWGVLDSLVGYECHVTYVLDPYPGDGTRDRLQKICGRNPRTSALVMSRRFGHQAALLAGLAHASGDVVVMMDSDLQHPPETIRDLLAAFERGADIVQAVRIDAPSTGWLKRRTSHAFYTLMSRVTSIDIKGGSADFRLFSRRVVDVFDSLPERNPFIRGLTSWVGFNVAHVEFTCRDREVGESKYTLRTLVEFALTGITSFSKVPLRAAAVTGFAMSFFSLVYAVFAIASFFLASYVAPGWASTTAVVSFVGGTQLLFLGLIAEYVGQIFDEVKARPRYLIDQVLGEAPATAAEISDPPSVIRPSVLRPGL
jgi:glycosyltransferase involved in cell wall biosynthesis